MEGPTLGGTQPRLILSRARGDPPRHRSYNGESSSPRWEFCDVPQCDSQCGTGGAKKQADYRGTISVTHAGKPCQKWTVQTPNSHSVTPSNYPDAGLGAHNFCRNPDGEPRAWCFDADAPSGASGRPDRWDYCDVRTCGSGEKASQKIRGSSVAIIVPVVIAAVILLAAILFLVRKRRVAARQPHRQSSMPTIGGDDEAEVEA